MSIATEITRLNNNIDNLKQIKQDIKNAVNNDFNEITNEQIEDYADKIKDTFELYKDQIPDTITTKLTRIDIDDAMVYNKNKLNVFGRTKQQQLSGKNLFNKDDYLFYRGYIVSSSNRTIHYESNNYMVYIPCKTNTNYAISKIITKRFAVGYTTEIPTDGVILQNVTMKNDSDTSISIQTGNDAQYLVAYIRNGNISGESSLEDIINSLQIEEGSIATGYEKYCGGQASPNPDYPQPIENVEGRSCTNLFSLTQEDFENGENFGLGKKVTLRLKPNTQYTCSSNDTTGSAASGTNIWFNGSSSSSNGVYINHPITSTTDENGDLFIAIRTTEISKFFDGTFWIQLNEGSTALPYEEYFEGKRLELNVCNKNLFDGIFEQGSISQTGSESSANNRIRFQNYARVNSSTTYTFNANAMSFLILYVFEYDENKNFIKRIPSNWVALPYTFTTSATTKYIRVVCAKESTENIIPDDVYNIQLEDNTTATPYEEHKEQMIPFPLQEGQKLMEGDYLVDDGVHHVKNIVDMSTLSYSFVSSNDTFQTTISDIKRQIAGTKFNGKATSYSATTCATNTKWAEKSNGTVGLRSGSTIEDSTHTVCFKDNRFVSATDFKNAMANNYLLYELEQEIVDPYTEEQAEAYNKLKKIMLNQGVNHIWTNTDGLEPNLQLIYKSKNQN